MMRTVLDPPLTGQDLIDAQSRTTMDNHPVLVGVGPVEFSTSVALVPWPLYVWDTNLFYWDLGVHWRASRKEIRQAYQAKGGESNVRLTMIVGYLLDPVHRRAYDLTPLGAHYFDDEIEEAVRHQAAAMATQAIMEGDELEEQELNKMIDELRESAFEEEERPRYRPLRYQWSYYVHKSQNGDLERLNQWRSAIIFMLRYWEAPATLSLGYMGETEDPFRICKIGYRLVLLVNESLDFDYALAWEAAEMLATQPPDTLINTNQTN
jgi:hypothetical protein